MTENRLNCAARIHKQKINNTQLMDKEEDEADKIVHQPSVLGLI